MKNKITKELVALLRTGDDEGVLDELVHDIKSSEASEINNLGFESQIKYLIKTMGEQEAAKAVKEAFGK